MPGKFPSVLAAAVMAAAALAAPAAPAAAAASTCADAPDAPMTPRAVFNDPVGGDGAAIVRTLCGLVRQTPAGARIQVAHFVMSGADGAAFADELIKADRRGVDVRVVVDGDSRGQAVARRLADALGTDTSTRSWLHVCTGPMSGGTAACIGDKGQHNKFYLFSRTGGTSDVIVQSSANLTDLNSTTYWNNAVVLPGNRRLYAAYDAYFADLAAERKNLDYYRVVQTGAAGGAVRASFFPKAEGDPVVDELDRVSCEGGATVRVGMSEWDTSRKGIAEKLRDLATRGCTVRIVYGIMDEEVRNVFRAEPRIESRVLGSGGALPGRLHSKYLLIEGPANGHRVLTGSHNYNQTSLRRNDETLLRLNSRTIYQQYVQNFERLREVAPPAP
ncbi:phospholipase D-like domain-containing protein [Nonomuraea sp. NPDC047897]|uniref:phospholipase D-like domain-containing protein n=1 Tax=Nonomuraea sp. NPDC047897 TaxID=3364346 RepID=UPI0037139DEE